MPLSNRPFLSLVQRGIGHYNGDSFPVEDWTTVQALAKQQGLLAVTLDGVERLPENQRPPKQMLLVWIGQVLHDYEDRFHRYQQAIASLSALYASHGIKMMVLKGYACSINWPRPEHRPCGDIDIWLFGKYREADSLLAKEKGILVDFSHHHHTVFEWQGFSIENHYDFLNVHHHRSNAELEKIFKQLGENDSYYVELSGTKVYLPSPNLHALFLLKHMMGHFAAAEITLRHLLDWAFYVKAHGGEIDWNWLTGILERFGMLKLFHVFNAICIEDLGFDAELFPKPEYDAVLKDRVLDELLSPEFSEPMPSGLLHRVFFKYRRWRANEWKHRLCYTDSMWSAFWSGVWNHLLKPKSI